MQPQTDMYLVCSEIAQGLDLAVGDVTANQLSHTSDRKGTSAKTRVNYKVKCVLCRRSQLAAVGGDNELAVLCQIW